MSSERRNSLSPPERRGTVDPGAHDLAESDSEEHYSDAQSGPVTSTPASPIPRTRVERVDDKPAYGEVPGTKAYSMREGDAEPDEIAIIPDPSNPTPPETTPAVRPLTPGGHPIPKTVVEESPDDEGAVTHPEVEEKHKGDPHPDLTIKADGTVEANDEDNDTPLSPSQITPVKPPPLGPLSLAPPEDDDDAFEEAGDGQASEGNEGNEGNDENDEADEFGDDFDDFEEGGDDGDFGDFDDGFQEAEEAAPAPPPQPPSVPSAPALSFPIPSFEDLDSSEIQDVVEPYLSALFPPPDSIPPLPSLSAKDHPVFLTTRSASLWSQLVAPPPLQPPDWIRSRIRRLFLVSLGVPVDLDEILPASKQKKLVLPSVHRTTSTGSLRSTDSPRSLSKVRGNAADASSTSVDSQGDPKLSSAPVTGTTTAGGASSSGGKRKKSDTIDPEKAFDLMSARQLCMTDEALNGLTDKELKEHVRKLEAMQVTAKKVLDYWQKKTDVKIGDREAFEGVIENLVKHARKVRK
ncbi:hypothetical protein QBC38DRAFT_468358 [Podospora fimiseda]|uniref:Uncharacterized protein n=1 Tax=Podospora fimiseda TaxID=252190 RepID=A0AAN7BVY5_9PEZI|nr:hypothetical protein QBC38DRAFT_468358 [Podospora fimiseda]